jgi:hypothetical protein
VAAETTLRITVVAPPAGVTFRVQRGKSDLDAPVEEDAGHLSFDVTVRVVDPRPDGSPDFRGPCVQGRPGERFVYVNSGTSAGQAGSCWTRRMKVHLAGIPRELADRALADPSLRLEARVAGTARDGGPACATVPLLGGGWEAVPTAAPATSA